MISSSLPLCFAGRLYPIAAAEAIAISVCYDQNIAPSGTYMF